MKENKLGRAPVPVSARSTACVCGPSLAGIVGSNTTGGMDFCFLCVVCYQVEVSASW
jgi:hypothetical protein